MEEKKDGVMSMLMRLGRVQFLYLRAQLEAMDLYPGQPQLLLALREREHVSQSALAQAMEVTPATLTVMLRRMDAKQFVRRESDPQDMRVVRLSLTEKGRAKVAEIDAMIARADALMDELFTPEELQIATAMMQRMHDRLSGMAQNGAPK